MTIWQLKPFSQLSNQELFEIYKARVEVFVVEQNCAYPEIDDKDLTALHLFAKNSQKLTAYCRIIPQRKRRGDWASVGNKGKSWHRLS